MINSAGPAQGNLASLPFCVSVIALSIFGEKPNSLARLTTLNALVTVAPMKRRKMTPADIVIFTGIAVNVVVIALIVYYFVL